MGELNQIPYNINKLYAPPSIESLLKIYIGHASSPSLKHVLSPCCIGIKKKFVICANSGSYLSEGRSNSALDLP